MKEWQLALRMVSLALLPRRSKGIRIKTSSDQSSSTDLLRLRTPAPGCCYLMKYHGPFINLTPRSTTVGLLDQGPSRLVKVSPIGAALTQCPGL